MISDKELQAASAEYVQALLASLPEPAAEAVSPQFARRIVRLRRRVRYRPVTTAIGKAAVIALLGLLSTCVLLTLHPQARASMVDWLNARYQGYTHYYSARSDTVCQMQGYVLTSPPEGYTCMQQSVFPTGGYTAYCDTQGRMLTLHYTVAGSLVIGGHDYTHEIVAVKDIPADLYLARETHMPNTLIWLDADGKILFQLTAPLPGEILLKLAAHIVPTETATRYGQGG